jgi:hypothetical protein
MLDALGEERRVYRSPGEADDSYRRRVAAIADTVSPNAIRRIANRIFAPLGGTACLREVGQLTFPGLYCDGNPGSTDARQSFPYDVDGITIRGTLAGHFFEGERAVQFQPGGTIASGRVTTSLPGLPGHPKGSPTPLPDPAYLELAAIHGTFDPTSLIVGERSGATFAPGGITGGLRTADRFKLLLDYTEFRAFFEVGVPPMDTGDFGVAFDAGSHDAFDAYPYLAFFDGFPVTASILYRSTWQAVDLARAGGVGFDLYIEDKGCV